MPADPTAGETSIATRFSITIDGSEIATFSKLVGIISEADHAGTLLKKLPGKRRPPTVVLRRALTTDTGLAAWHEAAVVDPATARRNGTLVMFDSSGKPVARYHLENAWPSKLEIGSPVPGSDDAVLYESVTLSCDRIERVPV
jgi:phage tail-like protein